MSSFPMDTDGPGTIAWRVYRAEKDISKLDAEKADTKDIATLTAMLEKQEKAFDKLGRTLQWFMGIVATAVIALAGIVASVVGAG